jgi:hypothetical protein
MREFILQQLKYNKRVIITPDFFNETFPQPKKPTVEEMGLAILASICSPAVEDRSKIAHVFQLRQDEQVKEFCERHNVKFIRDYSTNNLIIQKPA